MSSIPGQGTKVLHAARCSQKQEKKKVEKNKDHKKSKKKKKKDHKKSTSLHPVGESENSGPHLSD